MTILEALVKNQEIALKWRLSEDFASKTLTHIGNTLRCGVVGIMDKGYLLIYLINKQAVLFPVCQTADAVYMNKEAESVYYSGVKHMEVSAPSEQEIEELNKIMED